MGDPIVVRAQHNFQVTGVAVALTGASGNAIDAERDAASAHKVLCKNPGGQRGVGRFAHGLRRRALRAGTTARAEMGAAQEVLAWLIQKL